MIRDISGQIQGGLHNIHEPFMNISNLTIPYEMVSVTPQELLPEHFEVPVVLFHSHVESVTI